MAGPYPVIRVQSFMSRKEKSSLPRKRGPFRAAPQVTLSDEWRAWIVENIVRGASREELLETLVEADIAPNLAKKEIDAILTSPALPGCKTLQSKVERVELVLELFRTMATCGVNPAKIERRDNIEASEFFDKYYGAMRPVIFTGMLRDWPALGTWSPEYFATRFGHVNIEVVAGRNVDPLCDRNLDRFKQTMTMDEYCRLVRSRGTTNDIYLVSNNCAFEKTELAELLADLTPSPEIFDVPVRPGMASLWFGPGGTLTPLHHDISNILICQFYGRKRFKLLPPFSAALLHRAEGFYAPLDWKEIVAREEQAVSMTTVDLAAGEALFLPAGYWHEVEALEPSIHVSMLGFRRPNYLARYRPGFVEP
jgi:Cupin-like domain